MLRTLAVAFTALAVAPFFLAFSGAPSPAQTAAFGLGLIPFGAVALVGRTGWLAAGHRLCAACLLAAGALAVAAGGAGLGGLTVWLAVAASEGVLAEDGAILAATALGGAAVASVTVGTGPASVAIVGPACLLALVNAACAVALRTGRRAGAEADDARAAAVSSLAGEFAVTFDGAGSVAAVDEACERLIALPAQSFLGRGLFEHVHVADRPLFLKTIADASRYPEPVVATFRVRTPQVGGADAFPWVAMQARRIGADRSGIAAVLRDVTDHRRDAADLVRAREEADNARRSKDHFLANVSHELRTPLNAIIGFSEMLANEALRPREAAKQDEYARIIHQSGEHLLAVVNSILDMSKIQSGTFAIDPEPFLLAPIIESCREIMMLKAREGGIALVAEAAGTGQSVVGDRRAFKQILLNLMSNAVKFTPRDGRVHITTRPEGTAVAIVVADTGIGIGAQDLVRIGDPFFQAKSALNRPYEGTGLGLSVVRGLVGLHGGSMTVESEPGHGTSVVVRMPLDCRHTVPRDGAAPIETILRRTPEHGTVPSRDTKVKNVA